MDGVPPTALALFIVTVVLALFTIVFAELVPKTLALAHAERYAFALSRPDRIARPRPGPADRDPDRGHHGDRGLFGAEVTNEAQITAEELRLIIERGGEQGILEAEEEQMINAVIELGERRVHEVMVPRIAMVALPVTVTFEEAIETHRARATAGSRCTRSRSTRSSASSTRRTCCRS